MIPDRCRAGLGASLLLLAHACGGGGGLAGDEQVIELTSAKGEALLLEAPAPPGQRLEYRWRLVRQPDGTPAELVPDGARATLTAWRAGVVEVIREAHEQNVALESVRFLVETTNRDPAARIELEFATALRGGAMSAGSSTDPDGDPLQARWEVHGPEGATVVVTDDGALAGRFSTDRPGPHQVILTVEDGDGGSHQASASVEVHGPVFDPVPGLGGPTAYLASSGELLFYGPVVRRLDIATGAVTVVGEPPPGILRGVGPSGRHVWLEDLVEPRLTVYDMEAAAVVFEHDDYVFESNHVVSDDAYYEILIAWNDPETLTPRALFHGSGQQVELPSLPSRDGDPRGLLVVPALDRLVVAHGDENGAGAYAAYSLGENPELRESGPFSGSLRELLADGVRVVGWDGRVYRLSNSAAPLYLGQLGALGWDSSIAHNLAAGRLAVARGTELDIIDDGNYRVVASYDVASWSGEEGAPRVYPHQDGFVVVKSMGGALHSLYLPAAP